ncbi:H-type lectin domain-containing protein [Rhodobacter sp. Har01]|uniref:H-type lectin domain-containing protein n=1 Tax=Rhodobacter sp. Har01 TaxID=2883999 RepID=UPI001D083F6D|nr:H-type lectin domain-containing protein [Rhodobacter sp. Har01]MCB6179185.1 H-type lectin domain-containing protein [Rhodobacter sp. Har01]
MKRFRSSVGVLQGTKVLFSDFADGGQMWTGHGPRECRVAVSFAEAFAQVPAVTVGLTMWDMDHKTNSRVDLTAEDVTVKGFKLVFKTWGDTRIARVRADWMAIGTVRDDDDWEVD